MKKIEKKNENLFEIFFFKVRKKMFKILVAKYHRKNRYQILGIFEVILDIMLDEDDLS